MICERTHENILKQWGKSFSKQLEMPSTNLKKDIPSFTKIGHCILIREAKVYLWCWQETNIHLYRQRDNWNLSGPSNIADGPQSVIQAYKIHRTMGPQVPEKKLTLQKMFKTKKLKK